MLNKKITTPLPDIPRGQQSIFMQRLKETVNRLQGLGRNKNHQAVTRQDLIDLGLASKEDMERL